VRTDKDQVGFIHRVSTSSGIELDPAKRVELIITYPAYIGRSFDEILRVLDALQLSARHHVAMPANWHLGDNTVVLPFISDEEAEQMFAEQGGFRKVCGAVAHLLMRQPGQWEP